MSAIEATSVAETQLTRSSAVLEDACAAFCERARATMRLINRGHLDEVLAMPVSWSSYSILSREGEATETAEAEARAALDATAPLIQALGARRESTQRALNQHSAIRLSASEWIRWPETCPVSTHYCAAWKRSFIEFPLSASSTPRTSWMPWRMM